MLAENRQWWHDFWAKSFVHLHSADGAADFVEQHYTYFLYVMAASSRGTYMPRYGGMIWYSTGDMRKWGSQFWWHNQGCYYEGLLPANRLELMDPVFRTYSIRQELDGAVVFPIIVRFDDAISGPIPESKQPRVLDRGSEQLIDSRLGFR